MVDPLVGEWIGDIGEKIVLESLPGDRWEATYYSASQPKGLAGRLIVVDGVMFTQTELYRVEGTGSSTEPTYTFAKIEHDGNRMDLYRVRTEWLRKNASKVPGVTFSEQSNIAERPGGITFDIPVNRNKLLRMAIDDPTAFEPARKYLRLK